MKDRRSIPLDAFPWEKEEGTRPCDHEGCAGEGLYQAPCAPDNLETFYRLCLDHVRSYNKAWNFFAHMSPVEIETYNRGDTVGWRPSWPLGERMAPMEAAWSRFSDSFTGDTDSNGYNDGSAPSNLHWADATQAKALNLFDLQSPLTLEQLKIRYKELVKRYHPDANGGDKESEERLKQVNEAYGVLKSFICTP
jgi:hypothetical protein